MEKITRKYQHAVIATDTIIFTVVDDELKVLLIKMNKKPYADCWAAPGGLVKPDESVDASAKRNLFAATGVKDVYLEQLYTFGRVNRDPFGRVVSVAYVALIPSEGLKLKVSSAYDDIAWFPCHRLPALAYDHDHMIQYAVGRLRAKLAYTNIVYSLLPDEFTLTDMQNTYEIILGRPLDKRNFRKKILSLALVAKTGTMSAGKAHRPAALYRFRSRDYKMIQIM
jgi:8-oxo-dGTP diphosphatase